MTVSSPIDYTALLELAADIVNECQVGNITASLNISGACNSVTVPSSDPSDEAIVYNTPSPDHLVMTREPVAEYEGVPLRRQPKIQAVDLSVCIINEPWHEIPNNVVCATSKGSDQPAHMRSLVRAFACRLNNL